MKKKNNYQKSELTSKERKALRGDEFEPAPAPDPTEEEIVTKKRNVRIIAAVIAIVATIFILIGAIIPIYMATHYMFEANPVAIIKISMEDETYTLKYELFEEDSPMGVTNFCYLASIGFFDGTVIYDTQNKRVRFGGYEKHTDEEGKVTYNHRAYNEDFVTQHLDDFNLEAYPDRVTEDDHSSLYKYALRKDDIKLNEYDKLFTLNTSVFSGAMASTVFQIFGDADTVGDANRNKDILTDTNNNTRTYSVYPIGQPLKDDKKTGEAINAILALKTVDTKVNDYYLPTEQTVTIESVKIYNFDNYKAWNDKSKYKHGFESYMTTNFGENAFYTWSSFVQSMSR